MKTTYALVNEMSGSSDVHGRIISRHHKLTRAVMADSALQRGTKRANGASSYIPTCVVALPDGYRGSWAYRHNTELVDDEQILDARISAGLES